MSCTKCNYLNCPTKAKQGIAVHRFPREFRLCRKWIYASGNIKLIEYDDEEKFVKLKNMFICGKHFAEKSYMQRNRHQNKLVLGAVPLTFNKTTISDDPLIVTRGKNDKCYSSKGNLLPPAVDLEINQKASTGMDPDEENFIKNAPSVSSVPISLEEELHKVKLKNVRMEEKLKELRKKSIVLRRKCARLRAKVEKRIPKEQINCELTRRINMLPNGVGILVNLQFNHKNQRPYTEEEKNYALTLFSESPAAYKSLLQSQFILPSINRIREWKNNQKLRSETDVNQVVTNEIDKIEENAEEVTK